MLGQHSECQALVAGGHLHEGPVSARLGLRGRPGVAEEITVARDLALLRATGGRLHVLHASCARTVELVAAARAEGLAVTMEVTPSTSRSPTRRAPPATRRSRSTRRSAPGPTSTPCAGAWRDGVVDAIATDHAPHPPAAKAAPFAEAPPGMLGLETALGVVLTDLVGPGLLDIDPGARPALVAAGRHRRHWPVTAGRSRPASRPTWSSSIRGVAGPSTLPAWPAAPATPPSPGAASSAGPATRCSPASVVVAAETARR